MPGSIVGKTWDVSPPPAIKPPSKSSTMVKFAATELRLKYSIMLELVLTGVLVLESMAIIDQLALLRMLTS